MEDKAWAVEHVAATEFAGLLEEAIDPLKASAATKQSLITNPLMPGK